MIMSDEHGNVLPQFLAALQQIGNVSKTHVADAGTYEYSYAGLPETLREVKRVCAGHGLSVSQNLGHESNEHGDYLTVTTYVFHESGEWITWPAARSKVAADPQKMGSASTYLRRYSLTALFAIPTTDDDGVGVVRGLRDDAAEEAEREREARAVFDSLKQATVDQRDRLSTLRDSWGMTLSVDGLRDDGWRAAVIETMNEGEPDQ